MNVRVNVGDKCMRGESVEEPAKEKSNHEVYINSFETENAFKKLELFEVRFEGLFGYGDRKQECNFILLYACESMLELLSALEINKYGHALSHAKKQWDTFIDKSIKIKSVKETGEAYY